MRWVVQSNIYAEEGYQAFLDVLDRLGLERCLVKVIPFDGGLEVVEGELPPNGADAIVMGSYTLATEARFRRNWLPGAFLDNLDFRLQEPHWGDRMLNYGAEIHPFGAIPFLSEPTFIRPVHDTKAFTGFVIDQAEMQEWKERVRRLDPAERPTLQSNTPIMVCRRKEIWSETRTWIVDGLVVTASGYKVGTIKRYTPPEMVDRRITDFAQECADVWRPNDAFVLDVADTPNGLKITEINNLNSAGFYKGDMQRVVQALEDWAECPNGLLW